MNEENRKKIIILFSTVVVFAIGVLIYFFFIKTPTIIPVDPNNPGDILRNPLSYEKPGLDNNQLNTETQYSYTETQSPEDKKLSKIWDKPTAGFSFVNQTLLVNSTTTKTIKGVPTEVTIQNKVPSHKIYFVDSVTGFVYAYNLEKRSVYQISNSTIPAIYDAYIFNNGQNILIRYADGDIVKSLTAQIPFVNEGNSPLPLASISYLPNNISSVSPSLFDKEISYVLPNENGSSINTINSSSIKKIYTSLFSDWNISYGGNNLHLLTKPSSYILGTFMNLNSEVIVLRNKTGLNVLPSKTDNNLFASFLSNSGINNFIMSTKTGSISYLTFKTLSEKCEWGVNDRFILCAVPYVLENGTNKALPDSWYKGEVSFSDDIYIRDFKTNEESVFFRFKYETDEKLDIIKMKLNQEESYLGMINKKDKSFWLLKTDYLVNIDNLVD